MEPPFQTIGVGVDLGSATTTVAARRGQAEGPAPVALTVPATWNATRRRAHAEAAASAGFERVFLVTEPEAAARFLADSTGRALEAGTPLAVYSLGASACHVAVVRRVRDRYKLLSAKSTDAVGGRVFDRLLLEHLMRRHRPVDPDFWRRAADPGQAALRAGLLEAVRRARESLTARPVAAVALPGLEARLRLTGEEARECLTPPIDASVSLVEDALREAGADPEETAGLMLVGGASRTPPVASILGDRLGLELIEPESPELVPAEGAALAAVARGRRPPTQSATGLSRFDAGAGVLAASVVLLVSVIAATGFVMVNREASEVPGPSASIGAMPSLPGATGERDLDGVGGEEPVADPSAVERPPEPEPESTANGRGASPTDRDERSGGDSATEAPDPPQVPDVVGSTLAEAEAALAEAGFAAVAEGARFTGEGPPTGHCEVTAQRPESGARADPAAPITLTYVYVGRDDC